MALGGPPSQLHVGAADTIAKARRAAEASSVKTVVLGSDSRALASLSHSRVSADAGDAPGGGGGARWRTAVDVAPPPPSPLQALLSKLLEGGGGGGGGGGGARGGAGAGEVRGEREVDRVVREKVLPAVENVCVVVGKLPDPTVAMLAMVAALLCVYVFRPGVLAGSGWLGFLGAWALFLGLVALAALWGKTDAVARLREGGDLFHHPAEGVMEGLEGKVKARELAVQDGEEKLKAAKAQLDALRKELAKDPMAATPDAILVPNKKATALIAAGALGDGATVDRLGAEAVEAKRRADAKARSQMEWKARTEEVEGDVEAKENIRRLVDHANIVYSTHTKELRSKSGAAGGSAFAPDRLRGTAGKALSALPGRRGRGDGASASTGRSDVGGASPPSSPGLSASGGGASPVRIPSQSQAPQSQAPPPVKLGRRALSRKNRSSAKSHASGVSANSSAVAASQDKSKRSLFRRKKTKGGSGVAADSGSEVGSQTALVLGAS